MGFVAAHFDQFYSPFGQSMVWLVQVIIMILTIGFYYDDRHKGTICLQARGDRYSLRIGHFLIPSS